jgi:hypothetical protein
MTPGLAHRSRLYERGQAARPDRFLLGTRVHSAGGIGRTRGMTAESLGWPAGPAATHPRPGNVGHRDALLRLRHDLVQPPCRTTHRLGTVCAVQRPDAHQAPRRSRAAPPAVARPPSARPKSVSGLDARPAGQDTQPRTGSRRVVQVRLHEGQHHNHVRPRRRGVHPGLRDEGSCHRAQNGHQRSVRIALLAPPQPMSRRMPHPPV